MKKVFTTIAVVLIANSLSAQKLYTRINVGYGVSVTPEANLVHDSKEVSHIQSGLTSKTSEGVNFTSAGGGLQFGAALGYKLNPYMDVELGLHYLRGSNISALKQVEITADPPPGQTDYRGLVNIDITRFTRQIRLAPSLVINGGDGSKRITPYARLGLLVPVGGKTVTTIFQKFTIPSQLETTSALLGHALHNDSTISMRYETHGKLSVGLQSALGLTIKAGPVAIFAEVAHQAFAGKANYTELVKYEESGKDKLASKTPFDKRTNYVDELTNTSNNKDYNPKAFQNPTTNENDPNAAAYQKPKEDVRVISQFSNVGLNVGIKLGF